MIAAVSTVIAIAGWFLARSLYKDKQLAADVRVRAARARLCARAREQVVRR